MNRINWSRLPADPNGFSFGDLQKAYRLLYKRLEECRRMKGATETVLKKSVMTEREAKKVAKSASKQLITITKKQKAKEEAVKSGYWSGASAISVALTYELFKAGDAWPGGSSFKEFWSHEAMVSTMTFIYTTIFAWAYRCAHPDSR
jgi:hypothetical protein